MPSSRRIGLARTLSKLGYCSRSQAFELISAGKVSLNGRVRRDPEAPVEEGRDRIEVEGKPIEPARRVYLMMNKPRGLVTTASDEKGRETVYSLLPETTPWVAPVGRLDKASEGLLLLTNDSEWAARITAPESRLHKTYHVQVAAIPTSELLDQMSKGVHSAGELLKAQRISLLRTGKKNSWIEVVLDEGRNRQIRRMFQALSIEVLRLVRVAIGPIQLGDLAKGKTRALTRDEVAMLGKATGDAER
jgi:23S rRNA pseudouridine2605 synthase